MAWVLRKIDSLFGTVFGAVAGMLVAQLPLFVAAYEQRLGGHLDEARRLLRQLLESGTAQTSLVDAARSRVSVLEAAVDALADAVPFLKPVVFLLRLDVDIAIAALKGFAPALPLDLVGLAYGLAGIVLGWILYGLAKAPFTLARRRRARSL